VDTLLGANIAAVSCTVVVVIAEVVRAGAVVRVRRVDAGRRLGAEVTDVYGARLSVIAVIVVVAALLTTIKGDGLGGVADV
jgi:hypothetical protein